MPSQALHPSYGLLRTAQAKATKSHKYNSEVTRASISQKFIDTFNNKHAYDWQIDTCEALLLGLDTIVIAGTGTGKTYLFVMPLLMDQTCCKIMIVISPLNALEYGNPCNISFSTILNAGQMFQQTQAYDNSCEWGGLDKIPHQVCQHLLGMAFLIMLHQGHCQREISNSDYIP